MVKKNSEEIQVFTQSRMSDFMTCPRLEWYRYQAGGCGVKMAQTESFFLEGEMGHYALMHWYKNAKTGGLMLRKNLIKRVNDKIDEQGEITPDQYQSLQAKLSAIIGACHAYKAHYKPDLTKWKFKTIEGKFEVEICGVLWRGRVDLGVEEEDEKGNSSLGFIEHKFLTQFNVDDYNVLPISLQQLIYSKGFESLMKKLPQWYRWNVIKKSSLRRKGMTKKKDGSMPIPEPLIEYETRVQDQYTKEPEKMLIRTPPRLVDPKALDMVEQSLGFYLDSHTEMANSKELPPMCFASCTGRYGKACSFAPACIAYMAGHKEGYNAPECRGLYRAKEVQHEELED